jgi:hypothetical protein
MKDQPRAHLKFFSKNEKDQTSLSLYCNGDGNVYIEIYDGPHPLGRIALNRPTAIKLAKTLRAEIAKIEM